MPSIKKSALVNHTASELFSIVDDVDAYPQFLPWCGGASVLRRDQDVVEATVEIAHSGVHKSFTTRNRLQAGKMIEMELIEGPFKHLHGFWTFEQLGKEACKISLELEYEFSNKLLAMAIGPVFNKIASSLVDAYCQRADALYGKQ